MKRRSAPLFVLLLLVGACTGVRLAPTSVPPGSSEEASPPAKLGTSLDMEVGPSEYVGSYRASGILTDQTGMPVPGAAIRVTLTLLDGPGSLESYSVAGTVPTGASRARVGLRVNAECGCSGTADVTLYDAGYSSGGDSASLVTNGDFSEGLKGWDLVGRGTAHLRASDLGSGSMLRVKASPRGRLLADSAPFSVEAGQRFSATFRARVAPSSVGSGYFSVVFRGDSGEVGREEIPFAPTPFSLGTRVTDSAGTFRATFHPPGAHLALGRVKVEARFDGNNQLLPAYASGTIFVH